MKDLLKRIRPLRSAVGFVRNRWGRLGFRSIAYWEQHYAKGDTSGPGSYGHLAEFKAHVINDFVTTHRITSVIEFGCGDGNQLGLFQCARYIGLDVSRTAIHKCVSKYADDPTKSFFLYDPRYFVDRAGVFTAEVGLSLDVIYHLIEDDLFRLYMQHLFASASRHIIIYSSSFDARTAPHVRHRDFVGYVQNNSPEWRLIERIPNRHPVTESGTKDGSPYDFFIYALS